MCDIAVMSQDQAAASDFETRLVQALNHGGLLLLTSIGHRTGLLNAMAGQPPLTSQALAERAGLQERYVREWLGGMVAVRGGRDRPRHRPLLAAGRACRAAYRPGCGKPGRLCTVYALAGQRGG